MNWRDDPFMVFDLETTGVDTANDRIVSSCVAAITRDMGDGRGRVPKLFSRIVNPGIEVPEEASKIHGMTTEYVRQHGIDPPTAIEEAAGLLRLAVERGLPIIGMNLSFDLTFLDRECERYGIRPVAEHPRDLRPVVDVYVIDKAADPFRKGKRRLENLCANWGVRLEGAHDAAADALASGRVAFKMARGPIPRAPSRRPYTTPQVDIGAMKLEDLHEAQIGWYADQARNLATYFRGLASQHDATDPAEAAALRAKADSIRPDGWPFVPREVAPAASQESLW